MSGWRFDVLAWTLVLGSAASGQVTQRVSLQSNGAQGNGASSAPVISSDLRFVAFESSADNLVPGDTNDATDVFLRHRLTGATERVSVDSGGIQGNGDSYSASISVDGRFVAFVGGAPNLVIGDTNGATDVFVRDRQLGTTDRISIDTSGMQSDGPSYRPTMSGDGRFVAFESAATNLVAGDTNGQWDVFLRDRESGTTERVSGIGVQANGSSHAPAISLDGGYVAFSSSASNLVSGDTNQVSDIFLYDRAVGFTERVSVNSSGQQGDTQCFSPSVSWGGGCVAFASFVADSGGGGFVAYDVRVRDRQMGSTELIAHHSNPPIADFPGPSISAGGRFVAFKSFATDVVPNDTNSDSDVFVRDRQNATTVRVSVGPQAAQANGGSFDPSISADGQQVAFASYATNLVTADSNGQVDAFVHDRLGGPNFVNVCTPGSAGVIGCPCANPPASPDRGCDNSSSTGGASLAASGGTFVSSDSLILTTSGEKPTALSIVLQGDALIPAGSVYGQGVRCAGGALKRLYVKTASAGSITAPDFGAGDASVSARSAALGSTIVPGQSRWYLVYYRDPIVLGGCPAVATFNATQTGRVSWLP